MLQKKKHWIIELKDLNICVDIIIKYIILRKQNKFGS
jgi:hypothetical protein